MILTADYVLPITSASINHGAILVRDGRIEAVGELDELEAAYPDECTYDFGTAALMPGFVDAHSHLEYSSMGGIFEDVPYVDWKARIALATRKISSQDWEDAAFLGAIQALSAGITAVADVTNTGAPLRAIEATGQHGVIYREVSTDTKAHIDHEMAAADADIQQWRSFADKHDMLVRVGIAPGSLYAVNPNLLRAIGDYAMDGTPVAVHVAGSREEYDFIRYGSSPFALDIDNEQSRAFEGVQSQAFLPTGTSPVRYALNWGIMYAPDVMVIHAIELDDGDIARMAEQNLSVVTCPRASAKLGCGITPLLDLREAGIRVGLGTNSPAAADSIDPFEEMRFGLLLQRAVSGSRAFFTAMDVMRMATIDAAKILHLDDEIGSLEVGKRADIVAIDLSQSMQVPTTSPEAAVVHSANRNDVVMTMIDGRAVYRRDQGFNLPGDGAIQFEEFKSISERAQDLRRSLRK